MFNCELIAAYNTDNPVTKKKKKIRKHLVKFDAANHTS